MRTKFTLVLAALAVAGFGFSASQAMADSLNLSFSGNGVSINFNVGDANALNPQPLPPKGKFRPDAYENGPGKHFQPKYVEANYDDYDGYDDVPPQWRHGKHHRLWMQQGGYGDAVMLNPQPLPPKYKFHYVN
jgi:hypothetical protein